MCCDGNKQGLRSRIRRIRGGRRSKKPFPKKWHLNKQQKDDKDIAMQIGGRVFKAEKIASEKDLRKVRAWKSKESLM